MKQYFYEKSQYSTFKSNVTYHQVLSMSDDEFVEWARLLRKEVTDQWDNDGIPPVIGRDREGIIEAFSKLRGNECDFWEEDYSDDDESLGIIKNFNKDASPINQFFPTMMKTKISIGKSTDGSKSIYDHFADKELEEYFIKTMKRAVKRDSMYSWSRSITKDKRENPFWDGESGIEFVEKYSKGEIFNGQYKDLDIVIARIKKDEGEEIDSSFVYLTPDELQQCVDNGWLDDTNMSNIDEIQETKELKSGKIKEFYYLIRWYDKTEVIFPKVHQVFRLSCGQPVVNFPALSAKWIYENYTDHIEQDEPLHIYDSSAGWGGRIIGAMSSRKDIHYIGTDPNSDNFIDELGKSRYEYLADFYNKNCVDNFTDTHNKFFEIEKQSNTYDVFQDGSEKIQFNSDFQKYKGKLDLSFTSPPYFNRERYGDEGTGQSWDEYSEYDDWRDNFLEPTLTTIYEYLKNDRYILWNIADIKIGKDTYYPLEGDSIEILENLGCEYKGKLKMLMTRMVGLDPDSDGVKNKVELNNKVYKYEPILVFYKP